MEEPEEGYQIVGNKRRKGRPPQVTKANTIGMPSITLFLRIPATQFGPSQTPGLASSTFASLSTPSQEAGLQATPSQISIIASSQASTLKELEGPEVPDKEITDPSSL
jgi:hypothetical protein